MYIVVGVGVGLVLGPGVAHVLLRALGHLAHEAHQTAAELKQKFVSGKIAFNRMLSELEFVANAL